jgi:hypothetical protein
VAEDHGTKACPSKEPIAGKQGCIAGTQSLVDDVAQALPQQQNRQRGHHQRQRRAGGAHPIRPQETNKGTKLDELARRIWHGYRERVDAMMVPINGGFIAFAQA